MPKKTAIFTIALALSTGAGASWYWPFDSKDEFDEELEEENQETPEQTNSVNSATSWYWPFGSKEDEKEDKPVRVSELMEPATEAIDNASDLAAEGKTEEAVAEYRKALAALDKVELENPERAATAEFATLRNKRAYVNAAIDSMLLAQAKENAKAVTITDTTELEKKFAEAEAKDKGEKPVADKKPKLESQLKKYVAKEKVHAKKLKKKSVESAAEKEIEELLKKDPKSRKARLMQAGLAIGDGKYDKAEAKLNELLKEIPGDVSAMNMKALCEAEKGDFKEAEKTLDSTIQSNPRDYHAYYNMSRLLLQAKSDKSGAKRYYETGRMVGGPKDAGLEEEFE